MPRRRLAILHTGESFLYFPREPFSRTNAARDCENFKFIPQVAASQGGGPLLPAVWDAHSAVSMGTRLCRFRRTPIPQSMECTYRSPHTSALRHGPVASVR